MTAVLESVGEQDVAIDYLRFVCSMLFDLTRNVFDRIKGHVSSQQRAVEFAHILEEFSHDYEAMLRSDHPKWNNYPPRIRRSIRTLNLFDVTQIRHLMLAVAHHFTPTEAARTFELFVNWIVRLFIAGAGRVGRVESKYASLAHTIHTKQTIKTAEHLGKECASTCQQTKNSDMHSPLQESAKPNLRDTISIVCNGETIIKTSGGKRCRATTQLNLILST